MDIVGLYVNNNRGFGNNINALVIIICIVNLIGLVPRGIAYMGNLIAVGGITV
jgi:uncharacterized membrane protein YkgB